MASTCQEPHGRSAESMAPTLSRRRAAGREVSERHRQRHRAPGRMLPRGPVVDVVVRPGQSPTFAVASLPALAALFAVFDAEVRVAFALLRAGLFLACAAVRL